MKNILNIIWGVLNIILICCIHYPKIAFMSLRLKVMKYRHDRYLKKHAIPSKSYYGGSKEGIEAHDKIKDNN